MSHRTLLVLLIIPVAFIAASYLLCEFVVHPPGKVVMEKKSSDGKFTALVEEHTGTPAHLDDGAWDDDVYIRNNTFFGLRTHASNFRGKIRADGKAGIDIDWTAPDCLKISFCQPNADEIREQYVSTGLSKIKIQICEALDTHAPTESELALNNLACKEISANKFDDAISHLDTCLKSNPEYMFARANLSVAHNNRGMSKAKSSLPEALKEFYLSFYLYQTDQSFENIEQIDEANFQQKASVALHKQLSKAALKANDLIGAYVELELAARIKSDEEMHKELIRLEDELKVKGFLAPAQPNAINRS